MQLNQPPDPDATEASAILTAEDLSVELGGLPVLRGVSLTVHAGEAVALLGGNGSGKSTLVRSLLRLVPIERGHVRLFGTHLRRFTDWEKIGYVPQRSTVGLSRAKVKEVVGSGRLARRRIFTPPGSADRRAITAALETVDLADRANHEMAHLSGGQQQRVLIARALVGEPTLLVLDEPTAGVDLEHQQVLATVLKALLQRGIAVLVVLHEVGPLTPLINRVVVLRDGRVAHDGPLPESLNGHDHHAGHEYEPPEAAPWLDGAIDPQDVETADPWTGLR